MARKAVETPKPPKAPKKKPTHKHKEENHMAPDRNGERRMMAATIAAGVIQVDSERVKDVELVAQTALDITDAINELIDNEDQNGEEHNGEEHSG